MRIAPFLLFFVIACPAWAQQADSSKGNPRGSAAEVRYYDYFFQQEKRGIDTSLKDFSVFMPGELSEVPYGHLGPAGSAAYPLLFGASPRPGIQPGWNAFGLYRKEKEDLRYYNPDFPLSDLYYAQGIYGLQLFKVAFGLGSHPDFDLGFNFNAIADNGFFNNQTHRDNNLDLHFRYKWNGGQQVTLAGYLWNDIKASQNGGLDSLLNPVDQVFRLARAPQDAITRLNAGNRDQSHELYLHHRFLFGVRHPADSSGEKRYDAGGHELFFDISASTRKYEYIDQAPSEEDYPRFLLSTDSTHDVSEWRRWQSRAGWKYRSDDSGSQWQLALFESIERNDFLQQKRRYLYADISTHAIANAVLRNGFRFEGRGTWYSLGAAVGDWQLKASLRTPRSKKLQLGVEADLGNSAVPLVYRYYLSNHYYWDREGQFEKSKSRSLRFFIRFAPMHLEAGARLTRSDAYLYFDEEGNPRQYPASFSVWQISAAHMLRWGHFRFENRAWVQFFPDEAPLALPRLILRSKAYFDLALFEAGVPTQVGVELRYHSPFLVPLYFPVLNQFGIQSSYNASSYPVIEPYASMKIKSARIFVRISNADQLYPYIDSYEWVKDYPQFPVSFTFGVSWRFFN